MRPLTACLGHVLPCLQVHHRLLDAAPGPELLAARHPVVWKRESSLLGASFLPKAHRCAQVTRKKCELQSCAGKGVLGGRIQMLCLVVTRPPRRLRCEPRMCSLIAKDGEAFSKGSLMLGGQEQGPGISIK